MKYLILSTSLRTKSKSRLLGECLLKTLLEKKENTDLLDLRTFPLPFCDGESAYEDENVEALLRQVQNADGIIICSAIYNYDVNAACKNLIELTGEGWENTVVGLACAAGGMGSYMSPMGVFNSLMLDFRSVAIPRYVYAEPDSFTRKGELTKDIQERLGQLADTLVYFTTALNLKSRS